MNKEQPKNLRERPRIWELEPMGRAWEAEERVFNGIKECGSEVAKGPGETGGLVWGSCASEIFVVTEHLSLMRFEID